MYDNRYSDNSRFEIKRAETTSTSIEGLYVRLITDKKTGVQYMCVDGHTCTVLVDRDGKPLIAE
ncbi:hypothetical protein FACS1894120_3660 [Clostridia bacterium]|nr:hypothetical protein FACS1894120_3660 [Clostridia bacterium]